ncbi:MAG TPA: hypothetical protein VE078_12810, partial [Thermoanaerobaculia bacterium]|nr:hypothetical protein [Thermoanaerobaculia bacterium]
TVPSLSLSLYAFRRRPFPGEWPLVQVRLAPLERLQLPPATTLPGTPLAMDCPPLGRSASGQSLPMR